MKKMPFYTSINKSTHPLQLIHFDVVSKFITSYNGFNYYVTVFCNLEYQLTGSEFIVITYPVVDFLVSGSPPKSAST